MWSESGGPRVGAERLSMSSDVAHAKPGSLIRQAATDLARIVKVALRTRGARTSSETRGAIIDRFT